MVQSRLVAVLQLFLQALLVTVLVSGFVLWWHARHPGNISAVFDAAGIITVVIGGLVLTSAFESGASKARLDARIDRAPQPLSLPWRITIVLLLSGILLFVVEYLLRAHPL